MKTNIENYYGDLFEVQLSYSHSFAGHGHWKIECEVVYQDNFKSFFTKISDSLFIDKIYDLKQEGVSLAELEAVYFDYIHAELQESIIEWLDECKEKQDEFDEIIGFDRDLFDSLGEMFNPEKN